MTNQPPVTVRVTKQFSARPERVFDAWLDPRMIGTFMFGPQLRDEEVVHLKVEARVGGQFSFLVRRQGQEIDHVGTYQELERPRRLVFTWGIAGESIDESRVIVELVSTGTGCELTLTHEMAAKWADYADRTRGGWTKMIDALAKAVDANPTV